MDNAEEFSFPLQEVQMKFNIGFALTLAVLLSVLLGGHGENLSFFASANEPLHGDSPEVRLHGDSSEVRLHGDSSEVHLQTGSPEVSKVGAQAVLAARPLQETSENQPQQVNVYQYQ